MDHFMVKRAKFTEEGGCDSTHHTDDDQDEDGSSTKIKQEMVDSIDSYYSDQSGPAQAQSTRPTLVQAKSTSFIPTQLPEVPFQPEDVPPYRDRRRPHLFQKKWYKEYPWLHYDAESQGMFCFQCISAVIRQVAECPVQNIFVRGGFRNWKKGIERFRVHENTHLHRETSDFNVKRLFGLKEKCIGVESIVQSASYLVSVGYNFDEQALFKLLNVRKNEIQLLNEHLTKAGFSPSDERMLLTIMTSSVMKVVSSKIKEAGVYCLILEKIIVDDRTMFAVSAHAPRLMKIEEYYLGMYEEQNIWHELVNYLDADGMKLYSCDMVDSLSIAQALEKIQPQVLHCPSYRMCLDVQDLLKKVPEVGLSIELLHELVKLLKGEPYIEEYPENQKPMCPRRNFATFKTLSAILTNYSDVVLDIERIVAEKGSFSTRFIYTELRKQATFFHLVMCKVLFYPVENLNGILIKSETIKDIRKAVDSVLEVLQGLAVPKEFDDLWHKVILSWKSLEVSNDPVDTSQKTKTQMMEHYFHVIKEIVKFLQTKFHNSAYNNIIVLENALLQDEELSAETETVLKAYDIYPDGLVMEKRMLRNMMGDCSFTLNNVIGKLREMTGTLGLIPETLRLVGLLMLSHNVYNTDARSHRMKNLSKFLEINKCSEFFNELSILYVYKDEPLMNTKEVALEYIESDQQRLEALFS